MDETDVDAEATLRRELLLAFHVLDMEGLDSGIAGHLTARIPGAQDFWCHSHGLGFGEVGARDLNRAGMEGRGRVGPSLSIHAAIYRARPDVGCIVHAHDESAVALTATGAELEPLYQSALLLAGDVATHRDYGGIVETEESGRALADALGARRALLLANHGTLVVGASVREAVHAAVMLSAACRIQLRAMAAAPGRRLHAVDAATASEAKSFLLSARVLGMRWDHYVRRALAARPGLIAELSTLRG